MAKGRKTGGRQKGSLNWATLARQAAIAEELAHLAPEQIDRMSPKDAMLWIMHIALKNEDCRMALLAAEKAAPYVHAKLASVSVQAEVTDVRKLTDTELTPIAAAGLSELDRAADSAETLDPLH